MLYTQNKNLLIALIIGAVVVAGLSWKVLSSSNSGASAASEAVTLTTDPNPLRTGPATLIIDVKDKAGGSINDATVSFDLNMTTMDMGSQRGNAIFQGNGRYIASGRISMRGPWKVTIKVTMPDGVVVNKDFTVNVP
ncbi:MAG: hypothetical protein UV74_C0013G0099 [Candidatus Woesebacteria bacterium GW2011_GWB1_43_14]|uniref:YtkA-like domain-containing protein n=1 Tax=Candidatus Woesebacteria bacterium GW2011_GWB1_43_14 TaxID=1618578 RepID=A0A0G1DHA7_9BACT|nr:MAG: hypothetical protein UV51_C0005G0125 [Candidatus Woesebacteria bacterium GW2011_GWC1_42_9]KKS96977.1 MAG: hypothetical protein UV74_C0013G0099 [Candidatus Woesebacteria bacterium GW2011_GWB1_43_14]